MSEAYSEKMAWFEFNALKRRIDAGESESAVQDVVQRLKGHADKLSGPRRGFWISEAAKIGVNVP